MDEFCQSHIDSGLWKICDDEIPVLIQDEIQQTPFLKHRNFIQSKIKCSKVIMLIEE